MFPEGDLEQRLLEVMREALSAAGFWEMFNTSWICLDCELMPWSAKAQQLLVEQYAPVGIAATTSLAMAAAAVRQAIERGVDLQAMLDDLERRRAAAVKYVEAYGRYCWPVGEARGAVEVLRQERPTAILGPVVFIRVVRVPRAGHCPAPNARVVVRASNEGLAFARRADAEPAALVTYGRGRRASEFRGDVIAKYRRLHGNDVLIGPGHYFGTLEVPFQIQGTTGSIQSPGQAVAAVSVANQAPRSSTPRSSSGSATPARGRSADRT